MRRLILGLAIGIAAFTPTALLAGDQDTAQQIAASLKNSGRMKGYNIGVKVQDGVVWLNGTVKSEQQLTTALDIVQHTPDIQKIVNGLKVDDGGVQQVSGDSQAAAQLAVGSEPDYDAPSAASHVSAPPRPLGTRMASMPARPIGENVPNGMPIPAYTPVPGGNVAPAHFDHPSMPGYAWPSYASYPNYAAVTYPRQYSPTAWPFIGPFYPYPQVPLGWRKVTLEWHNGWWNLDFKD